VFPVRYEHHLHIKTKTIPVTGRAGLLCCWMMRIPHCLDTLLTDDGEVVSVKHRYALIPRIIYIADICCLVVKVPGYRSSGPGFDSRSYQIF
jgi:hypothetical protein